MDAVHMKLTVSTLALKCDSCNTADPALVDAQCVCPGCSITVCRSCVKALGWDARRRPDVAMADDESCGAFCGICADMVVDGGAVAAGGYFSACR